MVAATTIKGGKVKVLLGNDATPIVYTAPCGFTSKSITLSKALNEVQVPDCDDPDQVDWLGRDAVSLSMGVSGEGVLAAQSVETWLDAWESVESVPVKVEWEFPAKTITYTGRIHVETVESTAPMPSRVRRQRQCVRRGSMIAWRRS